MKLNQEQVEFAINTFSKWMHVCVENGRNHGPNDVDHSSLLRRLLKGKSLHKNPPPCRYSYPAWELVEDEIIEIHELHDSTLFGGNVVIDQNSGYEWEDKVNKIIKHKNLGILYQYYEEEVIPKNIRKDLNPEDHKYIGKFLKRLNDPITGKEHGDS